MYLLQIGKRIVNLDNVTEIDLDANGYDPSEEHDSSCVRMYTTGASEGSIVFFGQDADAIRNFMAYPRFDTNGVAVITLPERHQ